MFALEQEDFEQLFEAVELPQFVVVLVHNQLHQLLPVLPTSQFQDLDNVHDDRDDEIHAHDVEPLQSRLRPIVIMLLEFFS
jgi:hypothetical protein